MAKNKAQAEWSAREYARRVKEKFCPTCKGKTDGKVYCDDCLAIRKTRRLVWLRHGLCGLCGGRPLVDGHKSCAVCLRKQATSKTKYVADLRRGAAKRGLAVTMTDAELVEASSHPCHYCGGTHERGFNGLDRKDEGGYTTENVVACCWTCNEMKGNMSYAAFTTWVRTVAQHLFGGG